MSGFSKFQAGVIASLIILLIPLLAGFQSAPDKPSPGLRGLQEYFASGTFTPPVGVTHVMVTMWGAGGGGGGGSSASGGGGGAYTNTVLAVSAGVTYTVTVGSGGLSGAVGDPGSAGGDSQFALNGAVLAFAGGGQGGSADNTPVAGGAADSTAQISHRGNDAYPPSITFNSFGAKAYAFNLSPNGMEQPQTSIGDGGDGGGSCCGGNPGKSGYVLLTF
jgi:Glycine-rich domain